MRNKKLLLLVAPLMMVSAGLLSSCDSNEADFILRILNSEDYIYLYEDGDEESLTDEIEVKNEYAYQMDMIDQFELIWEENNPGKDLEIVYDTFDTNETMFNELQTGKTTYDVVVTSDYMVQKLASKDMLYKFTRTNEVQDNWDNISSYIYNKLLPIECINNNAEAVGNLTEFCVPYMWGTIGIMYNPAYYIEKSPSYYINKLGDNYDENEDLYDQALDIVIEDFASWDVLYRTDEGNPYSKSFSIKDSVRDTFAISTIHANGETIDEVVRTYGDSSPEEIGKIMNIPEGKLSDAEFINEYMSTGLEDMQKLKANAFGFETDSGKTDMTTQKIGANLCWSGDATWAMTEAEDFGLELYFSLPLGNDEDGYSASNIWFDCFAMPKNHEGDVPTQEEQAQYDLTEEFIRFMGRPENAVQNSYCVGYTPATAGQEVFDYMYEMYSSEGYIALLEDELANLSVDDFDSEVLFNEYKEFLDEELAYEKEYFDTYEDDLYDLSYFFGDELSDPELAKFVPYSYYAQRQLPAQYPTAIELNRLAIMKDFGDKGTQALLDTWETLRTNPLPVWAIVVFAIEGVAGLALAALFISKGVIRKKLKKERK